MPACSCTTSVCCLLTRCGNSALKWTLPPMVLATLSHRACNYFILYLSDGFCHTVPSGELYFIVLCLIIPGSFCHTEPPGELYFCWINKDSGNISTSWISVTRICHHYRQLLSRRNCEVPFSRILIETTRKSGTISTCCLNCLTAITI